MKPRKGINPWRVGRISVITLLIASVVLIPLHQVVTSKTIWTDYFTPFDVICLIILLIEVLFVVGVLVSFLLDALSNLYSWCKKQERKWDYPEF